MAKRRVSATKDSRTRSAPAAVVKFTAKNDPFFILAQNIFCEDPPSQLSFEQLCALHEFYHEVCAAGFKLYQKVPPERVYENVTTKLKMMTLSMTPQFSVPPAK